MNEDRIFVGPIHKITIGQNPGDPKSMGYSVGSRVSNAHPHIVVDLIELEESLYEKFGKISVIIWCKDTRNKDNRIFPYKIIVDCPITLSRALD